MSHIVCIMYIYVQKFVNRSASQAYSHSSVWLLCAMSTLSICTCNIMNADITPHTHIHRVMCYTCLHIVVSGSELFIDSGSSLAHAAIASKAPGLSASIKDHLTAGVLKVSCQSPPACTPVLLMYLSCTCMIGSDLWLKECFVFVHVCITSAVHCYCGLYCRYTFVDTETA